MSTLDDALMTAEADAYAAEHGRDLPHAGLDARHEAHEAIALAYLAIDNGWTYSVEAHLEAARLAAALAFPAGSNLSRSLRSLIDAAEAEAETAGLLESAI